jgi:hypothetical protein
MTDIYEKLDAMENALRQAMASQGVHEFVLVHLLMHLAQQHQQPDTYLNQLMDALGASIRDQLRRLRIEKSRPGMDTLAYFEEFKAIVMAGVTPSRRHH